VATLFSARFGVFFLASFFSVVMPASAAAQSQGMRADKKKHNDQEKLIAL